MSMFGVLSLTNQQRVFSSWHKLSLPTSECVPNVFTSSETGSVLSSVVGYLGQSWVATWASSRINCSFVMDFMASQLWRKHSAGVSFVPIKRVWQFIKQQLNGEVFPTLQQLRERLQQVLKQITPAQISSLSSYDFILEALCYAASY